MIEIPEDVFMEAAEAADFDDIRKKYNGRHGATNSIGLVGSMEQILRFFARLGADSEDGDAAFDLHTVNRLADSMAWDSMGHSDTIYYWSGHVLSLTGDED